jgi:poly-D-alanine transfer protein DltD
MNSDNGARLSFFLNRMAEELVNELRAHQELITKLEEKIINLQQVADRQGEKIEELSQAGVKGYNATDLGNMVSEIQQEGLLDDYIDQRITDHPEVVNEDTIRELARDEAEEVLRNTSFSVTVD